MIGLVNSNVSLASAVFVERECRAGPSGEPRPVELVGDPAAAGRVGLDLQRGVVALVGAVEVAPKARDITQQLERARQIDIGVGDLRRRHCRLATRCLGRGIGEALFGALGRQQAIVDCSCPRLTPLAVVGQDFPDFGQPVGLESLDRVGDPKMQTPAAPRRQLGVRDLPGPLMREPETLADAGEEPPADQLFHGLRRRVVVELANPAEQLEVELASDRRGHGEH
jgi:hypothetical protein